MVRLLDHVALRMTGLARNSLVVDIDVIGTIQPRSRRLTAVEKRGQTPLSNRARVLLRQEFPEFLHLPRVFTLERRRIADCISAVGIDRGIRGVARSLQCTTGNRIGGGVGGRNCRMRRPVDGV